METAPKCNGVRRFDIVRPPALAYLFCDTNFALFRHHDAFIPKKRPATASTGNMEAGGCIAAGGVFRSAGHGPRADVAAWSSVVSDVRLF